MTVPYRVVGDQTARTTILKFEEPYPHITITTDLVGGTRQAPVSSAIIITGEDRAVWSIRVKPTEFDQWTNYTATWVHQPPDWLWNIATELGFTMWYAK